MGYASQGLGGPLVFSGPVRQLMPVYPAAGSTLTIVGGWENGSVMSPTSRTNLLLQSQSLNVTWAQSAVTIGPDAETAPDGTSTADKIQENSANTFHFVSSVGTTVAGQTYTASVYLKAGERSWASLSANGLAGGEAYFNLATGTVGTKKAAIIDAKCVSVGGGWFRCSIVYVATSTTMDLDILPKTADNQGAYTGTTGYGIFAWGAQLETGAVPSRYTPTTTTAVAETGYSYDQSTGLITLTRALASDASWMTFGTVVTTPTATNTIYQASAASTV